MPAAQGVGRGRWVGNPPVFIPPLDLRRIIHKQLESSRGSGAVHQAATPNKSSRRSAAEAVLLRLQQISEGHLDNPYSSNTDSDTTMCSMADSQMESPKAAKLNSSGGGGDKRPSRIPHPNAELPSTRREAIEATPPYCDFPSQIPTPSGPTSPATGRVASEAVRLELQSHRLASCDPTPRFQAGMQPPSTPAGQQSRASQATGGNLTAQKRPRAQSAVSKKVQGGTARRTRHQSTAGGRVSQRAPASGMEPFVAWKERLEPTVPTVEIQAGVQPAQARRSSGAVPTWASAVRVTPVSIPPPEATNVRVVVRVRPRFGVELKGPEMFDINSSQRCISHAGRTFRFDATLGPKATQSTVYTDHCKPLVDAFLEGRNATILAYGQTGSGKTYTMGTGGNTASGHDGCLMRTLQQVLSTVDGWRQQQREEVTHELSCQFLEIYNEEIRDLLHPSTPSHKISIRETPGGGIVVTGLREAPVRELHQVISLFYGGCAARATGTTNVNKRSSRSHAVFTLHLKQLLGGAVVRCSKMHIVDLAGSERNKKTGAVGLRFKEAISINKGLLALGNVISALGDKGGRASHVPYRDSKITRLLADALGGDHLTAMIACISPAAASLDESLNTLKYAARARNITNVPKPPVPDQDTVTQYLVDFCEGVTPESAGVPEDIVAGMAPPAVLAAMARVRHSQSDLRAQLSQFADVTSDLQRQVEEQRIRATVLLSECNKARAEAAEAHSRANVQGSAAAIAKMESAQRRAQAERARHTARRALAAVQLALRDPGISGATAQELTTLVEETGDAVISPLSSAGRSCNSDTEGVGVDAGAEWRSHPLSAAATGGSVTPAAASTSMRGYGGDEGYPLGYAGIPRTVEESPGCSAASVRDSSIASHTQTVVPIYAERDSTTPASWMSRHPKRSSSSLAIPATTPLVRRKTAAGEVLGAGGGGVASVLGSSSHQPSVRLKGWLKRMWQL